VGRLPLDFICPAEVCREIESGMDAGFPAARPAWVRPVGLSSPLDPLALAALDLGEAAVIQLALEQGASRVCIDERKGRQAALAVGLRVTGALGLLARAKELGLIPALRPAIEKLRREGAFYSDDLVQGIHSAG
jgi:predicted nucleic acid-binding protein